ncbi:hypothetical protein RDABS01_020859 [Bienertia sinuspersici]
MDDVHTDDSGTNNHGQFSVVNMKHASSVRGINTIQELGKAFHDTLMVKGENLETGCNLPSDDDDGSSSSLEDKDTESGDSDLDQEGSVATSSKCFHKSATFPVSVTEETSVETMLENKCCMRSVSLPTESIKIVSAMKGSREKEGMPPRKLSVSWAPGVYDPQPTSLSHYPKKKVQQVKSNKKHGKGKQKGKAMRGGGSGPKDKKHYRKMGGRSDKSLDSFANTDRVLSSKKCNSSFDLLDFDDNIDIGSPDSNCGSSFLQAGGAMHCVC